MAESNASVTFDPGTAPVDQPLRLQRWRSRTQAFVERLDGLELTMLRIPAGRFLMGSPEGELEREADEAPVHEVSLGEFLMARTPITQAQWRVVAGWQPREGKSRGRELNPDPSRFQGQEARLLEGEANTDQRPVERVSWHEAMEFCSRLSQRTFRSYTLPSEAQWEYACRSGTITPFHFGDTITPDLANYDATRAYGDGPKGEDREQTTPASRPTPGACRTCTATCGSGAWTTGTAATKWHRAMGAPGWIRRLGRMPAGCCAAAPGTTAPGTAARPSASTSPPGGGLNGVGFRVVCLPQGPS